MPAQLRWMALRATVLATVVLATAFVWTAGALAYDASGTASAGQSAVQDTAPASAIEVPAAAGSAAALDTLRPDGSNDAEPAPLQMMNGDNDWDSGWWIVMVVMMVAMIALVVWGILQFTGDRRRDQSPLDIARERLARGEITKEEFDRIRGDLA